MFDPITLQTHASAAVRPARHAALALLAVGMFMAGCRPRSVATGGDTQAAIEFDPNPPAVGGTGLKIALTDTAGHPVRLGHLDVEGNMNHAGMRPIFTRLEETEPGHYAGTIQFTMGGDWFLLLSAERPDRGHFEKKIDVPGVGSK